MPNMQSAYDAEPTPGADLRSGYVSDPVHEFIPFTGIERTIIDHPSTQRLRRISQTGLSSYIYPELVSSRFGHALGAMHLASQFLASSIRNSSRDTVAYLTAGIEAAVRRIVLGENSGFAANEDPEIPWDEAVEKNDSHGALSAFQLVADLPYANSMISVRRSGENDQQFSHRIQERMPQYAEKRRKSMLVAEQALRLATLFHDIGHLPFSHTFEDALNELRGVDNSMPPELKEVVTDIYSWIGGQKLHEYVGLELGDLTLRDVMATAGNSGGWNRFAEVAFKFTAKIWSAPAPQELSRDTQAGEVSSMDAAYSWLKSLISGELDVDRADYILRDGRNYGFDFASFDMEQLLGQIRIVLNPDNGVLRLVVRPQGVGYMESFILARYRSYQYGAFHHKADQVACALKWVLGSRLKESFSSEAVTTAAEVDFRTPDGELNARKALARQQLKRFMADLVLLANYKRLRLNENLPSREVLQARKLELAASPWEALINDDYISLLRRFETYDDYWMTTILRQIDFGDEVKWDDLVWWRQRIVRSLWKRPSEFESVLKHIDWQEHQCRPAPNDLRGWNAMLAETIGSGGSPVTRAWKLTIDELASRREHPVLISYRTNTPMTMKVPEDGRPEASVGLLVGDDASSLTYLSSVSPLVASLADAWRGDLHLRAFAFSETYEAEPWQTEEATSVIVKLWKTLEPFWPVRDNEKGLATQV